MKQRRSVDFLVIQVRKTLDFVNAGIRGRVKARLLWLVVAAILIGGLVGFINVESSFAQVKTPTTTPTWGGLIWNIQCVDCLKSFRATTDRSLRLDTNNRPHIAYGTDYLYYAWYDGMAWHVETVDNSPGSGSSASLALDAAGNPHISYAAPYAAGLVEVCPLGRGQMGYSSQWTIAQVGSRPSPWITPEFLTSVTSMN